eukprot:2031709-Pyramimonas_sp.AAC.1
MGPSGENTQALAPQGLGEALQALGFPPSRRSSSRQLSRSAFASQRPAKGKVETKIGHPRASWTDTGA